MLPTDAYAPDPPVFTSQTSVLLVSVSGSSTPTSLFYTTRDGGATWSKTRVPFDITNGAAIDLQHSWSVPSNTSSTTVYLTNDGWQHWTQVHMNMLFERIYDLSFISPTTGWAFGDNLMDLLHGPNSSLSKGDAISLLKTTNDGKTWTEITRSVA